MKDFLGKKILFVTAHPDDESYLAAGTMLKNHRAGGESFIACATFGEKGKSRMKRKVTAKELKTIRKRELQRVSKFLKVSESLLPGLPDTKLREKVNQGVFFKKLLSFALKHQPDLIISFGKDGISGHMDHISAGEVAEKVAKELKVPLLRFSAPPSLTRSILLLTKRRRHGKYVRRLKHQAHNIEIKVDPKTKLKALQFHKSQFDEGGPFSDLSPQIAKEFLTREYFLF
jgi:LmbE family N-acetylglucosaminyl deacetylase